MKPDRFKTLCGRIGLEVSRPVQWTAAAALRAEVRAKLAAGASESEVDDWLNDKLAEALAAHSATNRRTFIESTAKAAP